MASAEYLRKYLSNGGDATDSSVFGLRVASDTATRSRHKKSKSKSKSRKKAKTGGSDSESAQDTGRPVKRVSNMQIVDDDVTGADSGWQQAPTSASAAAALTEQDAIAALLANDPDAMPDDAPVVVDAKELRGHVVIPRRPPTGTIVTLQTSARSVAPTTAPLRRDSSSSDESVPRRRVRHDSDSERSDEAPAQDRDLSPVRRRRADSDSDVSPPRRPPADLSPVRRSAAGDEKAGVAINSSQMAQKSADEVQLAALEARQLKAARMSSGASAGLQTASELKADMERVRREEAERLASQDAAALGRDAAVVVRDRKGRVVDVEAQRRAAAEKEARKPQANKDWSRGVAQIEQDKRDAEMLARERTSKFARTREDLDADMRHRSRWGDPVAAAVPQTSASSAKRSLVERALAATTKTVPQQYAGAWPPNRFDIPPGPSWDGVDRSNSFEKKFFLRQNTKESTKIDQYHYSVSEM
jgi:pre-mRNA-splicing factor CWC26